MNVVTDFVSKNKIKRNILKQYKQGKRNFRGVCLVDINFSSSDLRNADLSNADLSGAKLKNANLRDAKLINTNLRRADLRDAKLINVDFSNANLSDTNLRKANLRGANLRDANLHRADLHRADLERTNFQAANIQPIWNSLLLTIVPNTTDINGLYLALVSGKFIGSTFIEDYLYKSPALRKSLINFTDPATPIEKFFLRIQEGDNPENSWDVREGIRQLKLIVQEERPIMTETFYNNLDKGFKK